jgi:hypothetical protein
MSAYTPVPHCFLKNGGKSPNSLQAAATARMCAAISDRRDELPALHNSSAV